MKIMPPDLSCQQQLDYMQCMGATDKAIKKFKEIQATGGSSNVTTQG